MCHYCLSHCSRILKGSAFNNDNKMPMLPCKPAFQVIESECEGENLEILSMENTVLSKHYVIHIIGFHVTLMRPD